MTEGPLILKRRPLTVEAWQVTATNGAAIAEWAGGMWVAYTERIILPTPDGSFHRAEIGDWVVRTAFGRFEVESDKTIFSNYEAPIMVVSE
jgi:hypothetical protein